MYVCIYIQSKEKVFRVYLTSQSYVSYMTMYGNNGFFIKFSEFENCTFFGLEIYI